MIYILKTLGSTDDKFYKKMEEKFLYKRHR